MLFSGGGRSQKNKEERERKKHLENELEGLKEELKNEKAKLEEAIRLVDESKVRLDFIYETYPLLCQHEGDDALKRFRSQYQVERGEEKED